MSGPEVSWLGKCTIPKPEIPRHTRITNIVTYVDRLVQKYEKLGLIVRAVKIPEDDLILLRKAGQGYWDDTLFGVKIVSLPNTDRPQTTTVPLDGTTESRIQ